MTEKTLQLQSENAFFHAYNRGVDRQQIFHSPEDYAFFVDLMRRFVSPSELILLAFALMPNHFHLILHQLTPYAISRFIKRVCEQYARRVNRYKKRVGHLFQNNYVPKYVDSETYLLYLSRYVHLNPVAAGMVQNPEDWPYSSCRVYKSGGDSGLVSPGLVLQLAGGSESYWRYLSEETVDCEKDIEKYLLDRELL